MQSASFINLKDPKPARKATQKYALGIEFKLDDVKFELMAAHDLDFCNPGGKHENAAARKDNGICLGVDAYDSSSPVPLKGASGKVRRVERIVEDLDHDQKDAPTIYVSEDIHKLIKFKKLSKISHEPKAWREHAEKVVQSFSQPSAKEIMKELLKSQTARYNEIVFTIDEKKLPKAIASIRVFAETEEIPEEAVKKAEELQKALTDILDIDVAIKSTQMQPMQGEAIGADSMK